MNDDTGHDAASDLPWDDDQPLPPYPVIATDPDPGAPMPTFPGLPVSARWPDPSEELLALREFRADYDRLMSTEGQSHGEAIAALSGLVASVRQRPDPDEVDRRCAELREALAKAEGEREAIRLQALTAAANATMADMEREEESDAMFLRLTAAEKERDAALARTVELERATSGPHIPPALMRRIEALGFVPGGGEPVGWLVAELERLKTDHTALLLGVGHPMWLPSVADAVDHPDQFNATPDEVLDRVRAVVAERDELAATLANERAAWVDMREDVLQGGWTNGYPIEINDVLGKIDEYMPAACTEPTPEALAARSASGGGS